MDCTRINLQSGLLFHVILLVFVACRIPETISSNLPQQKYGQSCKSYLEEYANRTAEFTECIIRYTRPIRMCEKCVVQYFEVKRSYNDLMKLKSDDPDAVCKKLLVNVDGLEVIEDSFHNVETHWEKASCKKCFFPNQTVINDDTSKMLLLNESLNNCIRSHTTLNNSLLCDLCGTQYAQLNDFYDSHDSYNGFCMDIVDLMNSTRIYWSVNLGCCFNREKSDVLFLIFGFAITSFPVILYMLIWLCASVSSVEIQYQQRWTSRFHSRPTPAATIN